MKPVLSRSRVKMTQRIINYINRNTLIALTNVTNYYTYLWKMT